MNKISLKQPFLYIAIKAQTQRNTTHKRKFNKKFWMMTEIAFAVHLAHEIPRTESNIFKTLAAGCMLNWKDEDYGLLWYNLVGSKKTKIK